MLPSELISEKLLTVNNVAELLNISPTTVRGWLVHQKMPAQIFVVIVLFVGVKVRF